MRLTGLNLSFFVAHLQRDVLYTLCTAHSQKLFSSEKIHNENEKTDANIISYMLAYGTRETLVKQLKCVKIRFFRVVFFGTISLAYLPFERKYFCIVSSYFYFYFCFVILAHFYRI